MGHYLRHAIVSLVLVAAVQAEQVIVKSVRVGDLVKLTASESVGWDVESGVVAIPFETNEEQTACYLGTGPTARAFVVKALGTKTLANGKTVPHVAQRYVITVLAGDAPVPGPIPPGPLPPTPTPTPPGPTPADVPNECGVGLAVYRIAAAVGDKPACVAAAAAFDSVATELEKSNGSEAAIDAAKVRLQRHVSAALASDRWKVPRNGIAAALTAAERAASGWNYLEQAKALRECGAAFKAAGR